MYQFTSNESITGSPSDGTVYIRLVPDGDSITAEYTSTAPTWSDSKQGWYGTGADVNKRYIEFYIFLSSGLYYKTKFMSKLNKGSVFLGKPSATVTFASSDQYVEFDNVLVDTESGYDSTTNRYFFKSNGIYLVNAYMKRGSGTPTTYENYILGISSNPLKTYSPVITSNVDTATTPSGSGVLLSTIFNCHDETNDRVGVFVVYTGTAPNFTIDSYFEIIKLSDGIFF